MAILGMFPEFTMYEKKRTAQLEAYIIGKIVRAHVDEKIGN